MKRFALLTAVAAMALAACRSDSSSSVDANNQPKADAGKTFDAPPGQMFDAPPGSTVKIQDIQTPGGSVHPGDMVTISNVVVTAVDAYGKSQNSFWVEDPAGGPYSGILVFDKNPPGVAPGDVVTITAQATEFALSSDTSGRTDTELQAPMGGSITVTKTGTAALPAPAVVDAASLASDTEAEKWEGVLIQINNVAVLSAPKGTSSSDPTLKEMLVSGPFHVGSSLESIDTATKGACFASIVGVEDYFFDYKLLPRQPSDLIGGGTGCPATTETMCADSVDNDEDGFTDCADTDCWNAGDTNSCFKTSYTIEQVQMGTQGGSMPANTRVKVTGTVTAIGSSLFWIQDPAAGTDPKFAGVAIFPQSAPSGLSLGSSVTVMGQTNVFHGNTEISQALVGTPTAGTPLNPTVIPIATLADPTMGKPYQGVLVEADTVKIIDAPTQSSATAPFTFTVGTDASTKVTVSERLLGSMITTQPTAGTCYAKVVGPLDDFDVLQIDPRTVADLVPGTGCP